MRVFRYSSLLTVLVAFSLLLGPRSAEGSLSFLFEGSDEGGIASGELDFMGNGTDSLTVSIFNTSPTELIDPNDGSNAPGLTGFGFDATAPIPDLLSWMLTADDPNGSPIAIGSSDPNASTGDWVLTTGVQGIQLDFFPTTSPGVKGALYNPAQSDPNSFAAPPNYFTEATLTIDFDPNGSGFVLDVHDPNTMGVDASPLMRFQNVGLNGEGSLKLGVIPEAASIVIWGLLATIGVAYRRRRS